MPLAKANGINLFYGAANQSRTDDLVLTKDALYQLSHSSIDGDYYSNISRFCQRVFVNFQKNFYRGEKFVRVFFARGDKRAADFFRKSCGRIFLFENRAKTAKKCGKSPLKSRQLFRVRFAYNRKTKVGR